MPTDDGQNKNEIKLPIMQDINHNEGLLFYTFNIPYLVAMSLHETFDVQKKIVFILKK